MFRYLESLRKIGQVFAASLSSFVANGLLIFIAIVLFSIIGLHVFGGTGLTLSQDVMNFDTFFSSFNLVF